MNFLSFELGIASTSELPTTMQLILESL